MTPEPRLTPAKRLHLDRLVRERSLDTVGHERVLVVVARVVDSEDLS